MSDTTITKDYLNLPLRKHYDLTPTVKVLLIYWKESDNSSFKTDADYLETFFTTRFHYPVDRFEIPSSKSFFTLQGRLLESVHDGKSRSLIIIHYGGHGDENAKGGRKSVWAARSKDGPCLSWSDCQPLLRESDADFLVILDCCYAAQAARDGRVIPRNVELITACPMKCKTPTSPSFTRALTAELGAALDRQGYAVIRDIHHNLASGASELHKLNQTPVLFAHGRRGTTMELRPLETHNASTNPELSAESTMTLQMMIGRTLDPDLVERLLSWLTDSAPKDVVNVNIKSLANRESTQIIFNKCSRYYRLLYEATHFLDKELASYLLLEGERFSLFEDFILKPRMPKDQPSSALSTAGGEREHDTIQDFLLDIKQDKLTKILELVKSHFSEHSGALAISDETSPRSPELPALIDVNQPRFPRTEHAIRELAGSLGRLNDGLAALAPEHTVARMEYDWMTRVVGRDIATRDHDQGAGLTPSSHSILARKSLLKKRYEALQPGARGLESMSQDITHTAVQSSIPRTPKYYSQDYEIDHQEIFPVGNRTGTLQRNPGAIPTSCERRVGSQPPVAVLVEWRGEFHTCSDALARVRLNWLVEVLQEMSKIDQEDATSGRTFGILPCIGWTLPQAHSWKKIGIVFLNPSHHAQQPISLHEKISREAKKKHPNSPALGVRFGLARAIAKMFASVMAVGCIHRGVRSHNIQFFDGDDENQPYLAGFTESRTDQTNQLSSLIQDEKGEFTRYRPIKEATPGMHFQNDIYGVGVVLLEIAFWRPIEILQGNSGLQQLHNKTLPRLVKELLGPRVGKYYQDAVQTCLDSVNMTSDEECLQCMGKVQEQLARCSA